MSGKQSSEGDLMQSTGCGAVVAVYIAYNGQMCEVKILVRVQASEYLVREYLCLASIRPHNETEARLEKKAGLPPPNASLIRTTFATKEKRETTTQAK